MTRDEAIKIQRRHGPTQLIDILADLGVLKLEEPRSPYEKLSQAMGIGHWSRNHIMTAIDNAGLKLVEK